jgi:hypothetical protein
MLISKLHTNLKIAYSENSSKHEIINPFFVWNGNTVSWNNYLGKNPHGNYEEYFQWVYDNNQFSFEVADFCVAQVYYEVKEEKIEKASLAFLPFPNLSHQYLRFDLDHEAARDFEHCSYHVHFGYPSNMVRLALFNYPWPSEFMKFVLFMIGKEQVQKFSSQNFFPSLDLLGNKHNHSLSLEI